MKIDNNNLNHTLRRSKLEDLKSARYWILLIALLSCILGILYNYQFPPLYTSEAVLFVDQRSTIEDASPIAIPDIAPDITKMSHLARSKAMMDHLARSFELYHYYHINNKDPLKRERLYRLLEKRIAVKVLDKRALSIEVSDLKPSIAKALTNGIAKRLQEMIMIDTKKNNKRLKDIYSRVLKSSRARLDAQYVELAQSFEDGKHGSVTENEFDTERIYFEELISKISNTSDRIQITSEYYEVLNSLAKETDPPHVNIIRQAVQDIKTSPFRLAISRIFFSVFFMVFVSVAFILIRNEYRDEVMEYLTKKPDTQNGSPIALRSKELPVEDGHSL